MNELLTVLNKGLVTGILPILSVLPAFADKLAGQRQHRGNPCTTVREEDIGA